jgi:SNF2 family DNA or RNA helicase
MSFKIQNFQRLVNSGKIAFKQHQLDGVIWCSTNETRPSPPCGIRGGFIADEMGLGKTIMMIGTCLSNILPKTLIVLPNVLIQQWVDEIFRTTGHRALVYHGTNKKKISLDTLNKAIIVITTYTNIAVPFKLLDQPNHPRISIIHQVTWNRVVFDEAHHLRNKNSRFYGAKKLQTDIRWFISGTPVQNRKNDFYNLCSCLGLPASFYTIIPNVLDNFVLRRTKTSVGIPMPDLNVTTQSVPWNNAAEKQLSLDIHSALPLASADNRLKLYINARQSCVLPSMLNSSMYKLVSNYIIPRYNINNGSTRGTSKIDNVINTIVSRKDNGAGKLVFCHFRAEIDIIISRLNDHGISNTAFFDGRVSQKKRAVILSQNLDVLILQIQTGCEGLNLQERFSEIYFVSPHWNPSVEAQAIARCHRIGQTKPVNVFKFHMDSFDPPVEFISEEETPSILTLDKYITIVQQNKNVITSEIIL